MGSFCYGGKMTKIDINYLRRQSEKILEAAQRSGIEQNFLFITTFTRYITQLNILNGLEAEIKKEPLMTSKEYIKGRENIYCHPMINAYNKTVDSANRTATTLMKVITSLKDVSMDVEPEDELL